MSRWQVVGVLMMSMMGTGLAQETGLIKLPPPEMAVSYTHLTLPTILLV